VHPADPTARFAALVSLPPADIPLDEAALVIAAHADRTVDIAATLAQLDELAASCAERSLDGLRRALYVDAGFHGNDADYYDPRNSLLHEVILRRTGIPISLGLVVMEVGRRAGVPLVPIAMPGHFLVRAADDPSAFLDPFTGTPLDRDGAAAIFARLHPGATLHDDLLAPVGAPVVLARVLGNLAGIYRRRRDRRSLIWALELRRYLPGLSAGEHRELAGLLALRGRFDGAADVLEALGEPEDELGIARLRAHRN
jgi:regulator of sirC expression with transglutaminase-like and TPR domain